MGLIFIDKFMSKKPELAACLLAVGLLLGCNPRVKDATLYQEDNRSQVHFSPEKGSMNGPFELYCQSSELHLFYPCNPDAVTANTTHIGHAVSTDMIHWEHKDVALSPDTLGGIVSASVVWDADNQSGFGTGGQHPLVMLYTYHDYVKESRGGAGFKSIGLAYSFDNGDSWNKYDGNPVLSHPETDYKDPNVFWDSQRKRWVMLLSAENRITFYTSRDLKEWKQTGSFGKEIGREDDFWESPDLFRLTSKDGKDSRWILLVNIGYGESGEWGAGYFIGDFDGETFLPEQNEPMWLDHGKDFYAARTFTLPDGRRILSGWMNNWEYVAGEPSTVRKGEMAMLRKLDMEKINGKYILISEPVEEIQSLHSKRALIAGIDLVHNSEKMGIEDISAKVPFPVIPSELTLRYQLNGRAGLIGFAEKFGIRFSNRDGESLSIGYDYFNRRFYIDRTKVSKEWMPELFTGIHILPFDILPYNELDMRIILDNTSVEMFAMGGKAVMTDLFFPASGFDKAELFAENGKIIVDEITVVQLNSIWTEY